MATFIFSLTVFLFLSLLGFDIAVLLTGDFRSGDVWMLLNSINFLFSSIVKVFSDSLWECDSI